jgi:hypothetical protein
MNGRLVTDTTEFFEIDYGDEILVAGKRYTITGHEYERRFGIDSPKFWVKRAIDSETGEKKFIKLCFLESFEVSLEGVKIKCFRDPTKEARILELVKEHPYFMQGESYHDAGDNNLRVLDPVKGPSFYQYIHSLSTGYETYFKTILPGILRKLVKASEAIRFLHISGFKHGDIRNDHLIIERDTGNYVWIDFDYDFDTDENPLSLDIFGLGNILLYAVGKGFHNLYMINNDSFTYGDLIDRLEPGDFCVLAKRRLINLRKLYPFIPIMLNDILMHFSNGADVYYETVDEIIEDLNRCLYSFLDKEEGQLE